MVASAPRRRGAARARALQLPTVGQEAFRRLSVASLAAVMLIVATGAAVRLSGSGLGCPDWPSCYQHRFTAELSYHPLIEFGNRLVTVALTVTLVATLLGALRRRPYRRDLAWLAAGLVAGVLGQAVLGGIVVYTKLNPYLVMAHFALSMAMVAAAAVLLHRSSRDYTPGAGRLLVMRPVLLVARGAVALLGMVVLAGTAVTGAGPHSGAAQNQLQPRRIPVSLRSMAELHSSLALLLVGIVLALAVSLHVLDVPERVRRAGRLFVAVLVAQAGIGYVQYFTHLPALLVEVHVIGAMSLVVGGVQFLLALTAHPPEPVAPRAGAEEGLDEGAGEPARSEPDGAPGDLAELPAGGW